MTLENWYMTNTHTDTIRQNTRWLTRCRELDRMFQETAKYFNYPKRMVTNASIHVLYENVCVFVRRLVTQYNTRIRKKTRRSRIPKQSFVNSRAIDVWSVKRDQNNRYLRNIPGPSARSNELWCAFMFPRIFFCASSWQTYTTRTHRSVRVSVHQLTLVLDRPSVGRL